ncbi:hypothetical protein Cgig2_019177 [Carnegiea gigantea]|uniref:Uncharacterized protein n=1 Tax=Carnegiea gigantea TaxID=171969 RepID=A0A9Q1JYK3_9CARY|nr:hypothetical protein Cgig2_019177 [Carnegiea gigantea]
MVDTLKSLMPTITDTVLQQLTEQVKKAVEATNSARPLPTFDYVPTTGCEPSQSYIPIRSHRSSDEDGNRNQFAGVDALQDRRTTPVRHAKSTTASTPCTTHSQHTAWSRPRSIEGKPWEGDARLSVPRLGSILTVLPQEAHTTRAPKHTYGGEGTSNAEEIVTYDHGTKTTQCMEALHELAEKEQIDYFLKRWPRLFCKERESACPEPREDECSTETVATIIGGYVEGITWSA